MKKLSLLLIPFLTSCAQVNWDEYGMLAKYSVPKNDVIVFTSEGPDIEEAVEIWDELIPCVTIKIGDNGYKIKYKNLDNGLRGEYKTKEKFINIEPNMPKKIEHKVVLHELGHALGYNHHPNSQCLMHYYTNSNEICEDTIKDIVNYWCE
jgi:hypothetical protein